MEKITLATVKRMARQQFRADGRHVNIGILPNKVRPNNAWIQPCVIGIKTDANGSLYAVWNDNVEPFEHFLNSYVVYNCHSELSRNRGVHYYYCSTWNNRGGDNHGE